MKTMLTVWMTNTALDLFKVILLIVLQFLCIIMHIFSSDTANNTCEDIRRSLVYLKSKYSLDQIKGITASEASTH